MPGQFTVNCFLLHFSRLKLIKLQRSQGSLPQAIEIWQRERERETARKLQFSSLEGNHCKVFCAKQHPPSPPNDCFFQSQNPNTPTGMSMSYVHPHTDLFFHLLNNNPFLQAEQAQLQYLSSSIYILLVQHLSSDYLFCGCFNSADMTK